MLLLRFIFEKLIEEYIHKFIGEYPSLKVSKQLKQRLAHVVKNQKNDLEVLNLIGNVERTCDELFESDLSTLNSPKFNKLDGCYLIAI